MTVIDIYVESVMYFQTEIINDGLNGYISLLPVITFIYTNVIQQWYLKKYSPSLNWRKDEFISYKSFTTLTENMNFLILDNLNF